MTLTLVFLNCFFFSKTSWIYVATASKIFQSSMLLCHKSHFDLLCAFQSEASGVAINDINLFGLLSSSWWRVRGREIVEFLETPFVSVQRWWLSLSEGSDLHVWKWTRMGVKEILHHLFTGMPRATTIATLLKELSSPAMLGSYLNGCGWGEGQC